MRQSLARVWEGVWHVLLPPRCVFCETPLGEGRADGVCPDCWPKLPRWNREELPAPPLHRDVDSFNAPFLYEEGIAAAARRLKYGDRPELAPALASLMLASLPDLAAPLVVPVPMHWRRLASRQFNQSVLLAQELAWLKNWPLALGGLKRVKHTTAQAGKGREGRLRNLSAAFEASLLVEGKDILLIDDIWTTGTTAQVCARTLKTAGAASVHVCTLAYTPPQ